MPNGPELSAFGIAASQKMLIVSKIAIYFFFDNIKSMPTEIEFQVALPRIQEEQPYSSGPKFKEPDKSLICWSVILHLDNLKTERQPKPKQAEVNLFSQLILEVLEIYNSKRVHYPKAQPFKKGEKS